MTDEMKLQGVHDYELYTSHCIFYKPLLNELVDSIRTGLIMRYNNIIVYSYRLKTGYSLKTEDSG